MKRTLLLTLVLLLSTALFAQNRATILRETFDGSTMPTGWSVTGYGTGNWSISATNKAGGDANELMLYWSPNFNGISRVVTTPVDLTGITSVVFSLKHYLDNYSGNEKIGVATSSDNGVTWNSAWEKAYSSTGVYEVRESISTADFGKNNVLFCIYFSGDSYNINNWYFDNFEVFTQENLDLKLASIDVASVISTGDLETNFTVQNLGLTTVESFTIEFEDIVDGGTITETFNANLASLESAQITLGTIFNLNPGTYTLAMNIIEVNGTADDDASNNTLQKTFNAAMGQTQKIPMIEHFSSSTCGPCVSVNYNMSQLTANNPGKYTYTKYPMNWPNQGDPYYTDEAGVRQSYYGCSAVPQTFLDGADQGFTNVSQDALDAQYNTPAFANVRGAYTIEGNTINIVADFMSYVNLTDVRAFVSINEKTTTGNTGSNGETEFHHIMMKMMEDAAGNVMTINAGEYQRLEFSYDMSSTHVEEMSDLEVSLWLQDYVSKEVYNSHFAYENTEHCYPVQNHQMTENGNDLQVTWEAPEAGTPTGYMVIVNGEVVEESTTNMSYTIANADGLYIAEVVALYGDKTSVGTVTMNAEGNGNEDPCDTPTNLGATVEQNVEGFENEFKVTLTWDAVDGAEGYYVNVDGEEYTTTTNSYVLGLDTESTFTYTVTTECAYEDSEESEPYTVEVVSLEELTNMFVIYPNPAKDFVRVTTVNGQQTTVRIFNCLGMLVEEVEFNGNEVEINTSEYNTGIYFINVQTENGNVVKKMIVE